MSYKQGFHLHFLLVIRNNNNHMVVGRAAKGIRKVRIVFLYLHHTCGVLEKVLHLF